MEPITNEELFMAAAAGQSVKLPEPITRKEKFLKAIADFVQSGGATPEQIQAFVNEYLEENPPQAYTLPVGGDQLGGVKNGGNVVINEDGTMTAPEGTTESEGGGIFTNRCGVLLLDILRAGKFETDMSEAINELEDALGLTITDGLVWVAATTEANGILAFTGRISNGVPNRLCCVSYNGDFVAGTITDALEANMPNYYRGDLFLAKIPDGSVLLKVPDFGVSGIQVAPSIFSADGTRIADPGYGTKTIDLTAYPDAVYYSCNIKNGLSVEVWQTISENIKSFEFE